MVCPRCIAAVEQTLRRMGASAGQVLLGEVTLLKELTPKQHDEFATLLSEQGFELLDDKSKQLIEKIKTLAIQYARHPSEAPQPFSEFIASHLHKNYSTLSKLFSATEGVTIEHYLIELRIERIKELLVYDELTLSEIAYQLGYSSVAHLSAQFKKVTGLTPSQLKRQAGTHRKSLDSLT